MKCLFWLLHYFCFKSKIRLNLDVKKCKFILFCSRFILSLQYCIIFNCFHYYISTILFIMSENINVGKLYGLIGYPLGHSFSKNFFNQKFEAEKIDAEYVNFEIPDINLLMEVISENFNLNGLNVTIPYKEQVIPFLDELDADAANIGAVNVIKFIRDKSGLKLKGFNSDVVGFCNSIQPDIKPNMKKALVLGTGGAAKAVEYGLHKLGIKAQFVSRRKKEGIITYTDLDKEVIADNLIIVNTTPLGMYPHINECPDIPYQFITNRHLCYDLLYNPDETLFMKKAKAHGAEVKNGLEMLLLQAFVSYEIWTDRR